MISDFDVFDSRYSTLYLIVFGVQTLKNQVHVKLEIARKIMKKFIKIKKRI